MISQRYAKANNKYIDKFDSSEASPYIMYWGVSNLYGLGMSQPLPYGGSECVKNEIFNTDKILSLKIGSDERFIFEVELKYPEELHDLHYDYSLATERFNISKDMISLTTVTFYNKNIIKA